MKAKKLIFVLAIAFVLASAFAACAAKLPKLKMLSTETCPACMQMSKVLKKIDSDYANRLATEYIDVNKHSDVARHYEVRYVPTLIFIDANGKEFAMKVGYLSLDEVLEVFKKAGVKI